MFCAVGCSSTKNLYSFPNRIHDRRRRKTWLDFFDMEEPNIDSVFACHRHFSHVQFTTKGIRTDAVPDIPISGVQAFHPFRRKPKDWRKNVVVVTPRDPEFIIYRHETGVFPQNLFNIPNSVQPVMQMPTIKSVSCSASTQTRTRLCGLVEVSGIDEYRLNCFYCSQIFDFEKWSKFLNHLKNDHFQNEEAFKMSKYVLREHDYASRNSPPRSVMESPTKLKMYSDSTYKLPPTKPVLLHPTSLPRLLSKPQKCSSTAAETNFENVKISPPPLSAKPIHSNDNHFNASLADRLIKLLNETVLSSNFLNTEEDNILIIKNNGSDNIETSKFLTDMMNPEQAVVPPSVKSKEKSVYTASTRPIYTINYGRQDIPSRRHSLSRILLPLPKNKLAKLVQKRIAQQTLKNINVFEKIYKTVKIRHQIVDPENVPLTDDNGNKVDERQISNPTALSRCLKRKITETLPKKQKATEIVFEYSPTNIIMSLLEGMKAFPVLWEFHDQAFNKNYIHAIEQLCRLINDKWSLNITRLKMRRSIIRILRFYRFMLPCDSITFEEYFYKCAQFLPSAAEEIPRARCAYCCICFNKDSELRKHVIVQHKSLKWPYKCTNCFERFRERDEYELHKQLPHYEEIYKCEHCDKRFNRRHLHNKHVAAAHVARAKAVTHVGDATYICDVCKKPYRSLADLKRHKVYHGEKIYKCHLCPKAYSIKMTLKLHLKRHRKELDFMCEVCGKGFIRKAYLEDHMATHTGAKITCNICNLKLRKNNLNRHLRVVHNASEGSIESTFRAKSYHCRFPKARRNRAAEKEPRHYKCKICKINFDRLKVLKDHNKQVHPDIKRTPCKICNLDFMHISNLKRHYRCVHKLHIYQVFSLVYKNDELSTVLAMSKEELGKMTQVDYITYTRNYDNKQNEIKSENGNYFEQEGINSDKLQDEILKAVESLDNQEIKVDDDHSMHDFFTDLLKQSYK